MCTSHITLKKYLKLLFEVEFYCIMIYWIFVLTGYIPFSVKDCIRILLPIGDISDGFTSCYLIFFLFIPFLNILVCAMNPKQHLMLIALSIGIYSVWASAGFYVQFNYVTWFCILYIFAAYVRKYPNHWFDNAKLWGIACVVSLCLSWGSIAVLAIIAPRIGKDMWRSYYFVSDSNKVMALTTGFCSFMFFKNLHFYNKTINTIAASIFGVLMIHANSDAMRQWLWQDVLDNMGAFGTSTMVLHAIFSIFSVYIVCTVIDIIRIKFIEEPFFEWCDTKRKISCK